MAVQPSLRFGSLALVTPSNGKDGYKRVKNNVTTVDALQISVPGTAGSIKMIVGKAQTERTQWVIEFQCERCFATVGDLEAFVTSAETAASDTRNNLRTVYYGHLDDASSFSEENVDFEMEAGEIWKGSSGYWLEFVARFKKYGA